MTKRPTPETDAVAAYEGNWDTKALRMTAHSRKLERERDEARVALASEIALADRLAHNLKIASHAWNNPTEHPAITDWKKARHE